MSDSNKGFGEWLLSELVREYANIVSQCGLDSEEALHMRKANQDVPEFEEYANAFDQLKDILAIDTQ